jgi:hypothetical protein
MAHWISCTTGGTPPIEVSSPICSSTVCTVNRGGRLIGEATFRATAAHTAFQSTFHAIILGIETDLTAGDPEADKVCQQLQGVVCSQSNPLVPGNSYVWNLGFNVPANTPALSNTQVRGEF